VSITGLLRAVLTDVRPLQASADYRRLWVGQTVSQLGQQMTTVAIAIQVYDITGSSFSVGLVGLASLVPMVCFGLYGGAIADVMDRRRLALIASIGLWLLSLVLVAQAVLGLDEPGLLYAVVAAQSACFAVNNPARAAIIPRLLRRDLLPAANALSMASFNLGFTVGPLVGAYLIHVSGFATTYAVDAVTFTAALYSLFRLPRIPP
jgi:MFS family permease